MIVAARFALIAACLLTATGCASVWHHDDSECPQPKRYSDEWWAMQANSPVGARQYEKKGKFWPPYPRPVGPPQQFTHRYHSAHYWPWPYNCTDRQYILDVVQIQESNGWLTETTLYDYHFDGDSNELTVPGKLHLRWILENVPPAYRAVWIEQVEDAAVSQQRLNNVRTVAGRLVGEANLPAIALRLATPPARPAIEVDMIRRKELETIPAPRIPADTGAGAAAPQSGT